MGLSSQALAITIVYSIMFLLSIGMLFYSNEGFSMSYGVSYFISIVIVVLMVYDTHCLSVGRCDNWSWVRTTIYCIIPVLVIIMLAYAITTGQIGKKNADDDTVVTYTVSSIPLVSQEAKSKK